MKRLLCSLLSLTMALSIMGASAYATEYSTDETAVQETAQEYLSAKMRKIYFHQRTYAETQVKTLLDIANETASIPENPGEDSDAKTESNFLSASTQNSLTGFTEDHAPELMSSMDRSSVSVDDMLTDLQCMEDMTAYKSHVYEDQGFAYSNFDAQYHFGDVFIDGNYATVEVYEELNYQYSDCEEPSYELGEFNVVLVKLDGEWVIADVASDDVAFMGYYATGYNLEEEISAYDEAMDEARQLQNVSKVAPAESKEHIEPQAAASNDIAYNKQNAANYALTYTTRDDNGSSTPSFRNTRFHWFGSDCMNFCSQAVWAGFGGSDSWSDIPNKSGMDTTGSATWWCTNGTGTGSWASCSSFRTYVRSVSSDSTGLVCLDQSIDGNKNTLPSSASQLVGAVLHVEGHDGHGNTVAKAHAVFVNAASGNTRNTVMVCSYNRCRKNVKLSSVCAVGGSTRAIETIVPQTFKGGKPSLFICGDLLNVIVTHTATRNLNGHSNTTLSNFQMFLLKPDGSTARTWTANNTRSITASFSNWNMVGEWSLKLTGRTSSGASKTWYGTIRVV